ncbi:MAG TPA: DUF2892 domain-containing protein [Ramlibacter sp.]|nr:DUF2892 domain-containing protein [Ramlibacter sp.]
MKTNIGPADQWVRFALGFVLLFLAGTGIIGPWGYIVAVVPMLTAMVRYCPLYHLLGIQTTTKHPGKRS